MITTLIKTMDHIDNVVQEAYEQSARGFCINKESKSILFYNEGLEVFLIAYVIDLEDLEQIKTAVFNHLKWLNEIHYGEEG